MIHSLAGGRLGSVSYRDYAKVKILEGANQGDIYWYISNIPLLKSGDKVVVPLGIGNTPTVAEVLRIDKNVSSQVAPVPAKRTKTILRLISQ